MDGQRAGCRSRFSSFVDDAWLEAQLTQPESEDETGRAGPDDQNIAASHTVPRWSAIEDLPSFAGAELADYDRFAAPKLADDMTLDRVDAAAMPTTANPSG